MGDNLYGEDMTKNCICTGKGAFFLTPMGKDELCPRCDAAEIEKRYRDSTSKKKNRQD